MVFEKKYSVSTFVNSKLDLDNIPDCLDMQGTFDNPEDAVKCAKDIIDNWIIQNAKKFTSSNQMFSDFALNAPVPKTPGIKSAVFSSIKYAEDKIYRLFLPEE